MEVMIDGKLTIDAKSEDEALNIVKAILNAAYGKSVAPLPDWDPEKLRDEIQDLKLENDRLKQREALMLPFLKSVKCSGMDCRKCLLFNDTFPDGRKCVFNRNDTFVEMSSTARKILHQLEDL